ncbi:MAG: metallophosphoesterase [Chloroflexi bacterium]|nr:metallophosphoesterase [Chloroflexota bacterium]MCI0728471.1 metallophosphoesterase [Chloroflexota bacterium]
MLVIISDLHLTDGTTGRTIEAGAFEDFRTRLQELALDASQRQGDHYEPIEAIDLVLLGDIFDLLRSDKWQDKEEGQSEEVRPWTPYENHAFSAKIGTITDAILKKNANALRILRECSVGEAIQLPVPTSSGALDLKAKEKIPVPVRIHYLVGNHDWFYHIDRPEFEPIRQKVRHELGLSNPPGPFPHDPYELPSLMEMYRQYRVFARHGDIYDSFNYDEEKKERNAATLGDAIVVELINRFPAEVHKRMEDVLPPWLSQELDELANVRPSLFVPVWIAGLLNSAGLTKSVNNQIKDIWNELAEQFINLPFVKEQNKNLALDNADFLKIVLGITRGLPFDDIGRLVMIIQKLFWKGDTPYAKHAFQERALEDRTADYIVYGHTHQHEVVPLRVEHDAQGPVNQIYFNSGTWHAIHELAQERVLLKHQFVHYLVMTYLAFFKGDERSGRPFETWSGTLGSTPIR